jgi:predicted dehydrogenase
MRIGLIGLGFMGGAHISAIESLANVTLTAISSRTQPTPGQPLRGDLPHQKTGALPADARWYGDWRQLISDPEVDAVDICLPTHLHKEVALSAFAQGKHVLCEKPMALTFADCEEMLDAAAESGRVFMVAHVLRFVSSYRYAASFLVSTLHGAVLSCTMQRKTGYPKWGEWLGREECSGGAILDLLIHDIDQALKLFGKPDTVRAISDGEIDTMKGYLRYSNGLEVELVGGWYEAGRPFSAGFEIYGNGAELKLEAGKLRLIASGKDQLVETPAEEEYTEQMRYFIECCEKQIAPELCPPAESAEAVRIANLLRASRDGNGKELSC